MKEEELERLAREALEKKPGDWPPELEALHAPLKAPPESVKKEVRDMLAAALAAKDAQKSGVQKTSASGKPGGGKRVWYALAAILPLAIGVFTINKLRESANGVPVFVKNIRGGAALQRRDARQPLKPNERIRESDILSLPDRGSLVFTTGGTTFRLQGPALLSMVRLRKNDVRFLLDRGELLLFSAKKRESQAKLEIEAGPYVFRRTGTIAQIRVKKNRIELFLTEGSFRAEDGRGFASVLRAGNALLLARNAARKPITRPLTEKEKEDILARKRDALALVRGMRALDASLKFENESSLKAHYGELEEYILQDGRSFRGYGVKIPEGYRVHTVFGVVLLRAGDVREVRKKP